MANKNEPVKDEVKQYKPWPVMMNQWSIKWNNTNHAKQWWTSEEWGEATQTLPSKDEQIKHDVKQHKPCPLMKKQWIIKWKKLSHAQ